MGARLLYYLGPEGTFTQQAASEAARLLAAGAAADVTWEPCADAASIVRAVGEGSGWGVVAWENNVEGYVVPNLDMLIDARDVAGFARNPGTGWGAPSYVSFARMDPDAPNSDPALTPLPAPAPGK